MFTHILVGSDGSGQALKATRTAAEIAHNFGAKLTIVNVFNPWTVTSPIVSVTPEHPIDTTLIARFVEEVQKNIEKQTRHVLQERGIPCRFAREIGHPVEKIVEVAEREKADLIVLGSRGMEVFKSMLLGSVSDGVLHHAHCPVLIVR